jgi:citrate lyase beta subunit
VLDPDLYARLDASLAAADAHLANDYPGDTGDRQPVHTVYVPADRYVADLVPRWGDMALAAFDEYLPDPDALAGRLAIDATVAGEVWPRVRHKLTTEPIEDLRIDFEDGFGARSDAEEDATAVGAGRALQAAQAGPAQPSARSAPAQLAPFCGLRFKSLEPATRRRGIRTLDLFLSALLESGPLPANFIVTLPKVTHVDQVTAFVDVCDVLEATHELPESTLRFEVQVETPQAILAADGSAAVARMVHAADGRLSGLHYGTYDYSAACGIAAPYQSMEHPVADHAKAVMQLAAAGTGVRLSDGSTNVLPVGTPEQISAAWRLHARLVRRSLERGYYQGWDLHPLQLVTRYAATYAFYRDGMPSACERLRAYLGRTNTGILDEPATAQAMAALLVRGWQCGALDHDEVSQRCGADIVTLDRLYRRRVG